MSEENTENTEVVTEEKGTKELVELFDGLKVLGKFGGKVMKDGRISTSDFGYAVELFSEFDAILKAFDNIDEAFKEAKDLKKAELLLLIGKIYEVVEAFEKAKKGQ